jgi:protoheme IX farnesyltransferase
MFSAQVTNMTTTESSLRDFIELTKPTVTLLVVLSSLTGMFLAPGHIHPLVAIVSTIAIAFGSASSAVFNMWYDRDIDAIMTRTQKRPLVRGSIHPDDAIVFSLILGVFAISLMAAFVNYQSSLILLFSILFYVVIYTMWLKRSTDQNIVIGGIAGSLPPIIGWMSVSDSLAALPIILFLLIFFWTPAHFWALAICRKQDYAACSVPMLPVTKGVDYTKKQIFIYTLLVFITSLVPCLLQYAGVVYGIVAACFGLRFLYLAYLLLKEDGFSYAMKLFLNSITYLFVILISLIIDHYVFIPIA